jgi:ABC-type uncharacterized transport system substrate-binding protein
MMRRRRAFLFSVAITLGLLATPPAEAAERVYRIGVLCSVTCPTSDFGTFRTALAAFGYVEGRNLEFEYGSAEGDLKRLPDLASDMVKRQVDVIYTTWGTAAGLAAKRATNVIPVVVGSGGDLVASGIVASLNRPGANVTGVGSLSLDIEGKRLEFLAQLLPQSRRLAVFATSATAILFWRWRKSAPRLPNSGSSSR